MNRKRWIPLFLAVLLVLGLTACQDHKNMKGIVVEVQTDEAGNLTAFVVESEGKRTGVRIAEKTSFWPNGISSGTTEEFQAQFQKELQPDALVTAWCYPRRDKLKTADGETVRAYWATSVQIDGGLEREALTLRDGTPVDVLERDIWADRTYRLADGTELLWVDEPRGPENTYVMNLESFDDLNPRVQEKVRAYYEDRGLLYDEEEVLEQCYAAWRELGDTFQAGHISQSVSPAAAAERVMYFTTELTQPDLTQLEEYGSQLHSRTQIQDVFDRRTGEKLDIRDLFGVPWEEVRRDLPELVDWDIDPAVAAQIQEKLEPEYLIFESNTLSVWFPAGALEGDEYAHGFGVSYSNAPEGFFQPWAIPSEGTE